jgi:hypothetical protein
LRYCIDTSALVDAWVRHYSPDIMPSLWRRVDGLIDEGHLISSEEVLLELERKEGDTLYRWAKDRAHVFLPLDAVIQEKGTRIMSQFPKLVDERTGKSFADPWVIATASVHRCCVVTGEGATGRAERPKIPDVCRAMSIDFLSFAALIRAEGWTF